MRFISDSDLPEVLSDIRDLIERQSQGALRNILVDLHQADIAYILNELKKEERKYLFHLLPSELASLVLTELGQPILEQILEDVSEEKISKLVDHMDSDDAADIISDLPDDVASRVLDRIPDEVSDDVKELLLHDEDTAGGIMALEFVAVNEKITVNETIEEIRKAKDEIENVHCIWVVGDKSVLLGFVSLTDLVLADGNTLISKIMDVDTKFVTTDVDQENVAALFRKYDLVTLPVVNQSQELVGQITIDDILDVLDEEASEDLSIFAGASDEELHEESFLKISWMRLPWLLVAFFGEFISAYVIHSYQRSLMEIIVIAFFMPVIMAMGGNSGIQSSIIVIRGLATGEISLESTRRRFFRELRVSLFIGFTLGSLMALIVGFWLNNYKLGMIIGLCLNIVILQAAMFGGLIPFILKRANIDPALASGPFITTFNDILGLLIYLAIITASIPLFD